MNPEKGYASVLMHAQTSSISLLSLFLLAVTSNSNGENQAFSEHVNTCKEEMNTLLKTAKKETTKYFKDLIEKLKLREDSFPWKSEQYLFSNTDQFVLDYDNCFELMVEEFRVFWDSLNNDLNVNIS